MVATQLSISNLTNPEVRAKALITRRRNMERKQEEKQRMLTAKLETETTELAKSMRKSLDEDTMLSRRVSRLEDDYHKFNDKISNVLVEHQKVMLSHQPQPAQPDDKLIKIKSKLEKITESVNELHSEQESLETEINNISQELTRNREQQTAQFKRLESKIDLLFQLAIQTASNQHKNTYNNYSSEYNSQPLQQQQQQQQPQQSYQPPQSNQITAALLMMTPNRF